MITAIFALMFARVPKVPTYPFPPANPCSNPIKCPSAFKHLDRGIRDRAGSRK
jgi:hypothetical protein